MLHRPFDRRAGFTLIEIAISLMLVSLAVVTIFMVLPSGIRVQNQVRYKTIAAAKALEMMELMRSSSPAMMNDARDQDKEGVFPWDTRMAYRSMAPDMESYIASLRGTIRALPEAIAYRLDSDNDEIRELLDNGGQLYYFMPVEASGTQDVKDNDVLADRNFIAHSRKLLVGVVGPAQQNSILYYASTKVGPGQDFYPTPPTHGREQGLYMASTLVTNPSKVPQGDIRHESHYITYDALCRDPLIGQIMRSTDTYKASLQIKKGAAGVPTEHSFGYKPYMDAIGSNDGVVLRISENPEDATSKGDTKFETCKRRAEAYVVAALWYAVQTGLTDSELSILSPSGVADFSDMHSAPDLWRQVLAMRFLSHAATCLTRYYPWGFPIGGAPLKGDPEAKMVIGGLDFTEMKVTLDNIRAWHEASVRMAIMHADKAGPYHWGAGRPLNRQVMMDHPLVQLDVWTRPIAESFPFHTGGTFPPWVENGRVTRRQWRACYPQAIAQPGIPSSYPGRYRDTNKDGVIDPRDANIVQAKTRSKATPKNIEVWPYPARVLDTNADGFLDESDRPVPTAAVISTAAPALGDAESAAFAADLHLNGQSAVGPRTNFNLTAPFDASERCRQLVFWAADWQGYEDFETQASAAIDASRYPIAAPQAIRLKATDTAWTSQFVQRDDLTKQLNVQHGAGVMANSVRNPELVSTFKRPSLRGPDGRGDPNGKPTTEPVGSVVVINDFGSGNDDSNMIANGSIPDIRYTLPHAATPELGLYDVQEWNMLMFLGMFGVNRSGGKSSTVDVGPIPKSVRLRASTVCRFNFYDPRVSGSPF